MGTGPSSYGKGYFEWTAEGEGCSQVVIEFTMQVTRKSKKNGVIQTKLATYKFDHTLTVVNIDDPPKFFVTPDNFVFYEESASNQYTYNVKVIDPELQNSLKYECKYGTPEKTFTGTLLNNDGQESSIIWTHDKTLGLSYSGKITCTVSQTNDISNFFLPP